MPELPEVEAAARELHEQAAGRRLMEVERLDWPRMVEQPEPEAFKGAIAGRRLEAAWRRAKWILARLEGGLTLAIHLRMTGDVAVAAPEAEPDKHTHLVIRLDDDRQLWFRDPRKFGRVALLDAEGLAALEAAHGLEPLEPGFTPEALGAILAGRGGRLKPLLLDQTLVAGLGNIYADEALWEAGLHPLRTPGSLTPAEVARLHAAVRTVLERALGESGPWRYYRTGFNSREGAPERYLKVYDRAGRPCERCGGPIRRMVVAQRGTHLCPSCQPEDSVKENGQA